MYLTYFPKDLFSSESSFGLYATRAIVLFKATEFFLLSPCNSYMMYSGHGGSRAAEYLKEHLFENLLKHPQFITDTKLALSTSKFSLAHYYELHNTG